MDWSSSLSNNTTDSIGTFNFWQPWRSSNCIFNSLSQTYWQAKSSPIKAPQALSQSMNKENSYLYLFSVVWTNNMESDKVHLLCTNTESRKRKWKQRKDVYNGTHTSSFCFVFLFVLKIEHNAYFCVETTHQSLNKTEVKNSRHH